MSSACARLESNPAGSTYAEPDVQGEVVVTEDEERAPAQSDGRPRVRLYRREPDGSMSPMAGEYVHAIPFREGVAAVTARGALELVRGDGSRSVLARELDGLPARANDGALVYATRFGEVVELQHLAHDGENRRLASFRGSATRLSPQPDGRVLFVGSGIGGVAGVWIADQAGARCVTNCALRTGEAWGAAYRPPPGDAGAIHFSGASVEWQAVDGSWISVPLPAEDRR